MDDAALPDTVIDGPLYAAAKKIYPQRFSGPFRRAKWIILGLCLTVYYGLPFLRWDRGPNLPGQAVLVDLAHNRFYFFFIEIWPQEVYYFTGLLILAALTLFLMNAVAGRLWCGYLCPQTVWSDLFLFVEQQIEGDRRARMRLDAAPWTLEKVARKGAKHIVWVLIAWWTGGAWVLYFADAPTLVRDLVAFRAPMVAYAAIATLTATTYLLGGWMREQVCIYMCPWPRIQAALTDAEALNVTYRYDRGEPRASLKQARSIVEAGHRAGDCVDCRQCVVACPTGVDIRLGSQLACIQCGLCIDACDSVMSRIGRPTGLIAYDTDDNCKRRAAGEPARIRPLRLRTALYALVIVFIGGGMLYHLATRSTAGLSLLHDRTPLFVTLKDGSIRNAYTLRLLNRRPEERPFALSVSGPAGATLEVIGAEPVADMRPVVTVAPDDTREVRVLVTVPAGTVLPQSQPVTLHAADLFAGEAVAATDHFFAP